MAFYGRGKIENTSQWHISVFTDKICNVLGLGENQLKLQGLSQTKYLRVEFQPHSLILLGAYMLWIWK